MLVCANGSNRPTAVLSALPLRAAVAEVARFEAVAGDGVPLTATGSLGVALPASAAVAAAAAVFCANGLLCRKREL